MYIVSIAFEDGDKIPKKYTCEGEGINPPFQIKEVPKEAKSITLLAWDSDVPLSAGTKGNWDHWIVFNISVDDVIIAEGVEPKGVHGVTTSKTHEYVPPCPPDREHRYFFKIYALDTLLTLSELATRADVERVMKKHIIDEAQIMGTYCKKVNCK
jgi:Raf kinase inhibitor-like YbhB/YbcL family protein